MGGGGLRLGDPITGVAPVGCTPCWDEANRFWIEFRFPREIPDFVGEDGFAGALVSIFFKCDGTGRVLGEDKGEVVEGFCPFEEVSWIVGNRLRLPCAVEAVGTCLLAFVEGFSLFSSNFYL